MSKSKPTSNLTRLVSGSSVRDALFAFLLSRGIVLVIFILVGQFKVTGPEPGMGPGNMGPITARNAVISLREGSIMKALRETIAQGDVNHYVNLSQEGYDRQPFGTEPAKSSRYGFCPLMPALLWLIGKTGIDVLIGGAVLSNLLFFAALVLLHKLVLALGYDPPTAARTLFYLAFFPGSYFFSLPMTESLFLLTTVASFYAASKNQWLLSGCVGALASATRLNGVLLLPALIVLWWERGNKRSVRQVISLALVPLGLVVFSLLAWTWTGDPFAPARGQAIAARHFAFPLTPLWDYLRQASLVALPWNFGLLNFAVALLACAAVYFLLRQRQRALAFYVAMIVLLPLSTSTLVSMTRYMAVCFPIFIGLGELGRSERFDQIIRTVFIALFVLMTALFAGRFTMALT